MSGKQSSRTLREINMGQSVVIACPLTWDLSSFAASLQRIAVDEDATLTKFDDEFQMNGDGWWLSVEGVSDSALWAEDYATNELLDARFRTAARSLCFFTIRFQDVDVTRRILRLLAHHAESGGEVIWFDTDYGWVIDSRDFVTRTDQDPCWDWRHPADET